MLSSAQPTPSQPLAPGFPDLLLGLQTISLKYQYGGPCARLLRKQSASGMLCCTLDTKSGLPWWLHGKQPACQRRRCRRRRFDPWVGKIPWRRKWQPTPIFFPGKFHGQRRLVGYCPWDCRELDMTERACTAIPHSWSGNSSLFLPLQVWE